MSTPETKKSPFKKILGCGCGAVLFLALGVFAFATYLGISAEKPVEDIEPQSTSTPENTPLKLAFPKTYLGRWQDKSGNFILIRNDAKADFRWKDTDVEGGILKIDETKKILQISSVFGDTQQWKIDRVPQTQNGKTSITLDKIEFQRAP